ncbi:DUF3611 family protein [Candidatus Synechococcus spongiarum]|uniref:DUF3611 family protein n=1 Tax=Candidatus Synechococcus spongiarum TaxID=431041 RepID=UPI000470CAAA|nr:DUF3611 family protein [Candidatus Synechococcus spongiarum]
MVDRLDLQRISLALRRLSWGQFWTQLTLGVVAFVVLLLTSNGGLAAAAERSLGPGLALTTLAFLVLLFSLWQCWLVVRCGRALDSPGPRPSRTETSRLVRRGLLASLLGLTLGTVGYQALAGSLFVQASLQAPGFFGGPVGTGVGAGGLVNYPITSIEMLSVLSNTQVVTAHLVGLIIGLWLLRRIH